MTPTIKKVIIAAIILFVIVVCVVVYNKYKKEKAIKDAEEAKAAARREITINATAAMDAPTGVVTSGPGSKGQPIGM